MVLLAAAGGAVEIAFLVAAGGHRLCACWQPLPAMASCSACEACPCLHAPCTAMPARAILLCRTPPLQTREAISHARAAGCPIVAAITKCDAPHAQPEKVRQQLIAAGLELEEVGGNIQVRLPASTVAGLLHAAPVLPAAAGARDARRVAALHALNSVARLSSARTSAPWQPGLLPLCSPGRPACPPMLAASHGSAAAGCGGGRGGGAGAG